MTATTTTTMATITSLDYGIEAQGIEADSVNLLLLAHTARDFGIDELLVSLMIDETEPEVARIRAYSRVAPQVSSRLRTSGFGVVDERDLQPAC